jgi:glutamate-1-semialdehyde aminotransferase
MKAAILAAERQLEESKRAFREDRSRLRSALRARLARPSTLVAVSAVGALIGVWFARRNKTAPSKSQDAAPDSPSLTSRVSSLLASYGIPIVAGLWERFHRADPDPQDEEGDSMDRTGT